jgi:AraC-like DNA-binding protein
LSRTLEKENTSFSKLLDTVRRERAIPAIEDTNQPLKKVASLASFNSTSNFNIAFKAWTGMTPTAYRRQLDD